MTRITRKAHEPALFFSKQVIAGITVEDVLRWLANGESLEQVAADHPPLTVTNIRTMLTRAANSAAGIRRETEEWQEMKRSWARDQKTEAP